MRLEKSQIEKVLAWIAEGLKTDEINKRAARCRPPFSVDRQQVDFYRRTRGVALDEIREESESDALRRGLALKEKRVETLAQIAERLRDELLAAGDDGRLWLKRRKAIGRGERQELITEYEFNVGEINTLRALLDDIAKEMNARTYQRRAETEETPLDDEDLSELSDEELEKIANAGA